MAGDITSSIDPEAVGMIRFLCPHCGKRNKAPLNAIGRGGTCVFCGGGVRVPKLPATSVAIEPECPLHEHSPDEHSNAANLHAESSQFVNDLIIDIPAKQETAASSSSSLELFAGALNAEDRGPAAVRKSVERRRRQARTPWWIFVGHAMIPLATLYVIYHLRTYGYLPLIGSPPAETEPALPTPAPTEPVPATPSITTTNTRY